MFRLSIALVLLLGAAGCAAAATVYKCTDGKDHVAYQAQPCAAPLHGQVMQLRAVPIAAAAEPGRRDGTDASHSAGQQSRTAPQIRRGPALHGHRDTARRDTQADAAEPSWQCRVANGEVFYQHSPCPDRVATAGSPRDGSTRGRRRAAAAMAAVSARPLPRAEACRQIHAASASDRAGHERDEDVSTYERNLGRDPCR